MQAKDPLFKGCTRPALLFGVPLYPLALVSGAVLLVSIWTTIWLAFAILPLVFVMRLVTRADDQQFRLLGLRIYFRVLHYNHNGRFWRASVYSPFSFVKR